MASLSTLDLARNRISDQGLETFVRVTCEHGKALGHLTTLELSNNKLGSSCKAAPLPRAQGLFERWPRLTITRWPRLFGASRRSHTSDGMKKGGEKKE